MKYNSYISASYTPTTCPAAFRRGTGTGTVVPPGCGMKRYDE